MIKHDILEMSTKGDYELEQRMNFVYGDFQAEAGSMISGKGKTAKLVLLARTFASMVHYTQTQMIKSREVSMSHGGTVITSPRALLAPPPTKRNLEAKTTPKSEAVRIWKTLNPEEQSQLFWDQLRSAQDQSRLITEVLDYYKNVCSVKANQDAQSHKVTNSAKVKATQQSNNSEMAVTAIAPIICNEQRKSCRATNKAPDEKKRILLDAKDPQVALQ
jgi:hypothetical protein